jgi:hypothetical protein
MEGNLRLSLELFWDTFVSKEPNQEHKIWYVQYYEIIKCWISTYTSCVS